MKDPLRRLDIKKGCQEVDGKTALALLPLAPRHRAQRPRPRRPPARGDQRARHEAMSPWTFLNPVRYWQITTPPPAPSGSTRG